MGKMLNPPSRRTLFSRASLRSLVVIALASMTTYFLVFSGPSPRLHIVSYKQDDPVGGGPPAAGANDHSKSEEHADDNSEALNLKPNPGHHHEEPTGTRAHWEISIEDLTPWHDQDDNEPDDNLLPGYESDGNWRQPEEVWKLQHEKDLRKMWRFAYKTTEKFPSSNLVYGNTLKHLVSKDEGTDEQAKRLREDAEVKFDWSDEQPVRFNPYPAYNSDEWKSAGHAPYVPCKGPTGDVVQDLLVYRGRPDRWPKPKFGSYELLGIDPNLCWERETRLGPVGLWQLKDKSGISSKDMTWESVNWGELQQQCAKQNAARFESNLEKKNPFLDNYPETRQAAEPPPDQGQVGKRAQATEAEAESPELNGRSADGKDKRTEGTKESRTALLLRAYTGMEYSENDRQVIRTLISELSLKTGGQYEVFLLVHSKNQSLPIFNDEELYQSVLHENVPAEFHGITVLWNDHQVWDLYPALVDDNARSVHSAQWLSVQKFSQDHPEFDYIWNWEMDFRYTGHHYDLLEGIAVFAKKQPRKYLWERNERYYIPEFHGDYDTAFRQNVEMQHGNGTIWGPPELPMIKPVGPKPPVSHQEDKYEWGVGEEADFVSVNPIFNPVNSQWIIASHVWGYGAQNFNSADLPRRTTIVTQSRVSKRLLAIMHVENMRGNHVASEMTPQTVALLHGLKAVFAPHPVFMDRDWGGEFLSKWFNPGTRGEASGRGSPFGWGRERRFQGVTWYYRAEPPNRLYNNWMGWPDTGIGGPSWEEKHGRPCLPSVMLHPVKNTTSTKPDHKSGFELLVG